MLLVAEAANDNEALRRFRQHRPDVTLMDPRLPESSGIEAFLEPRVMLERPLLACRHEFNKESSS
jgi:CheY-like chemotaxis protein